jgi:hypothetical protein
MLSLGLLEGAQGRNAAAAFSLGDGAGVRLVLLGMAGRPRAGASGEEWYPDRPTDPGSPLGVAAARVAAVGARWGLDATGALSAGFGRRKGSFSHLRLNRTGGALRSATLFGVASPEFRTPEGRPCSYSWTVDQRLEVVAGAAIGIETSGRRVVERASRSLRSRPFRRTADAVAGSLEWTPFDRRGTAILLRGEGELEREWDPGGSVEERGAWELGADLRRPLVTLCAAAGGDPSRRHGRFEAAIRRGALSAEGRLALAPGSAPEWAATVGLEGRSGHVTFSLTGSAQPERPLEMELAWEQRYRPSRAFAVRK